MAPAMLAPASSAMRRRPPDAPDAPNRLDFALAPHLEAHEPPEARGLARDGVRLLVSHRAGDRLVHARFAQLPDLLRAGDLVVANDSATLPAALTAHRADGALLPLHLSSRLADDVWVVEPRVGTAGPPRAPEARATGAGSADAPEVRAGEVLRLPAGATATLLGPYLGSTRLWVARLAWPAAWLDYLHRWGRPIAYPYVRGQWPIERYQTVYAAEPGSAEMPSAGRAFSPAVLEGLAQRGIGFATLTLHAGVASLEAHEPPYPEPYRVSERTASQVNDTRARGGRTVAVGTTVVRALETVADASGLVHAGSGWTDLVVTPARPPRAVDALLTGFHEPRASHLLMLEAFAGRAHLARAYQAALAGGYLWHEFGDLHLIL